jgi:hypothetical protein
MEAQFIEVRIDSTGIYICGKTEFTYSIFSKYGKHKETEVTIEGDDGKWHCRIDDGVNVDVDLIF